MAAGRSLDGWSFTREYDAGQRLTGRYVVKVPLTLASSPAKAMRLAMADENIPQYLERPDPSMNLYAVKHQAEILSRITANGSVVAWRVAVQVEFVAAHLDESRFILRWRGAVGTEQTAYDGNGNKITVMYRDANLNLLSQTGEISAMRPADELVLEGIAAHPSPYTGVSDQWRGKTNSAAFKWWPAGYLFCSECSVEPWALDATPPKWRFRIILQSKSKTNPFCLPWQEMIYYRDPQTHEIPEDANLANGIQIINPYPAADFNSLFPFAR